MTSVSIITVTYNAEEFITPFLDSLDQVDKSGCDVSVIVVDNGSTDATLRILQDSYPQVMLIENDENNYARALNLGIAATSSEFVTIVNNDAMVTKNWLRGLVGVMATGDNIGAVQSKIFFTDSDKLNSVGVEEVEHFYFKDIGFEEEDSRRYKAAAKRDYITGGSVMFRRSCLKDVGPWDEEFILFMEDVDYSVRCRARGWELWFAPDSVLYHQYHGSTSREFCEYFCTRNRFLFVAKHQPLQLVNSIAASHFYGKGELDSLYRSLLHAVRRLCLEHDDSTVTAVLRDLSRELPTFIGEIAAHNFFSQLEVILGLRKIRVGIYDHAGHFAGGGQRYVAEMAAIMQERYDITYIFNNDVQLSDYQEWFDIDLTPSAMKIIRIPFFEERERYTPDEGMVLGEKTNPFDIIAEETLNYDIFVNANMLGKVNPLSPQSIFVCHFPDQERTRFFQVDRYDHLIINGDYTGSWVKKRWQLEPTEKLYPPVNMYNPKSSADDKENIILSVSRFEISGSKKQLELIRTFAKLCKKHAALTKGWKLVMIGGSTPGNTYIEEVNNEVRRTHTPIEIIPNASVADILEHYRSAKIFWHACGLDETRPERVEHFGMTTVEAMQNYCVPIVIDGGGQREIVEHGDCGFRFADLDELAEHTLKLLGDDTLRHSMSEKAYARSHLFNQQVFKEKLEKLLDEVESELLGEEVLPPPVRLTS